MITYQFMDELKIIQLASQAINEAPYPDPRFPPSCYYRFLKLLASEMKSRLSVELGVSGGGGSLHLALGNSEGKVIGVDYAWDHPERINYILDNFPNYTFIKGDSVEYAPAIYESYGKIDILFIDTTHTYHQTLTEYNSYKPFLSDRAIVCLDDLFRPHMDEAWNDIKADHKVRLDNLHISQINEGGFGVMWND